MLPWVKHQARTGGATPLINPPDRVLEQVLGLLQTHAPGAVAAPMLQTILYTPAAHVARLLASDPHNPWWLQDPWVVAALSWIQTVDDDIISHLTVGKLSPIAKVVLKHVEHTPIYQLGETRVQMLATRCACGRPASRLTKQETIRQVPIFVNTPIRDEKEATCRAWFWELQRQAANCRAWGLPFPPASESAEYFIALVPAGPLKDRCLQWVNIWAAMGRVVPDAERMSTFLALPRQLAHEVASSPKPPAAVNTITVTAGSKTDGSKNAKTDSKAAKEGMPNVRCWGCNQVGHRVFQCPTTQKVKGTDGELVESAFCRPCKCLGHYSRKCPQLTDEASSTAKNDNAPLVRSSQRSATSP